ncbi:Glucose dehydrogenase [FAD, quinone] [Toxocara canis]|uniref:Glucose dehydrogenase [FAD, quinone] n=1 Tax=Toxocara canis TaxID=6265 RepID=A0A0B2UP01_TOXCA|nr:Glucose dehydrogenase [FAD, quinone] [Toxocara canis]
MGFGGISVAIAILATLLYFIVPIEFLSRRYVKVKTLRDLQPQYEYIIVGGGVAGTLLASRLSENPNVFVLLLEAGDQAPWYFHSRYLEVAIAILATLLYFIVPIEFLSRRYVKVKTLRDLQPQYEYIIVGGGVAGTLLASRLSENPNVFVLLLEAGDQAPWYFHSRYLEGFFESRDISYEWNVNLSVHNDQHERWSYWRVLGGSCAACESFYDFPPASEWDAWTDERRLSDVWSWSQISDAFASSPIADDVDTKIQVVTIDQMTDKLRNAAILEGYKVVDEITRKEKIAFSSAFYWRKSDGGSASVLDYLTREVQSRFNLHILTGARATKVIFDMDGKATGVSYVYDGRPQRVLVNREVILSAGVVGSPHLLLLSGIGPEEQLTQFNVTLIRPLAAVGEQLAGPLTTTIEYRTNQDCKSGANVSFTDWIMRTFCDNLKRFEFLKRVCDRRDGSLTKWPTLTASLSASAVNKNSNTDLYVTFAPFCSQSKWSLSVQISLLSSYRSGSVRLQSSDASQAPLIEIQSREWFIDLLTKAALRVHELLKTRSFATLGIELSEWQRAKCGGEASESFFSCLVLKSPAWLFPSHTSSCAMGNMVANSVVDKYLRVHGVKRLRVVDASVLPPVASVRGALSSVLMLAEKAASIIRRGDQGDA